MIILVFLAALIVTESIALIPLAIWVLYKKRKRRKKFHGFIWDGEKFKEL